MTVKELRELDCGKFEYECECGKLFASERIIGRKGVINTCGCRTTRKNKFGIKNPVGHKFNSLTIESIDHFDKHGLKHWKCRCDCGEITTATLFQLTSDDKSSCGCKRTSWNSDYHGDICRTFWTHIMRSAKARDIEILITREQAWQKFLDQDRKCAYTNLDIYFAKSKKMSEGTASLDRIDSDKGYTLDNIQWVHKWVNIMKVDLKEDEFLTYCKLIVINKKLIKND
jgi:hypothetical protein